VSSSFFLLPLYVVSITDTAIKGKGETVPGTSINANDQVANQATGKADHLDLGFRKET
jgi:hypothetical protein